MAKKIPTRIKEIADALLDARELHKQYKALDESYTEELLSFMTQNHLEEVEGTRSIIKKNDKSRGSLDPGDYFEAVKFDVPKLLDVVTVRINSTKEKHGADYYLSEKELESITDKKDTPSLKAYTKKRENTMPGMAVRTV